MEDYLFYFLALNASEHEMDCSQELFRINGNEEKKVYN